MSLAQRRGLKVGDRLPTVTPGAAWAGDGYRLISRVCPQGIGPRVAAAQGINRARSILSRPGYILSTVGPCAGSDYYTNGEVRRWFSVPK